MSLLIQHKEKQKNLTIDILSDKLSTVSLSNKINRGTGAGGANTILKRALARTGKTATTVTDAELITAIYDERGANNGMKYFPSSTSGVRSSVVNRFGNEKIDNLANSTKGYIVG